MYSCDPDPLRVWKGGSEQHLLTPLPRSPQAPRAPRVDSTKPYAAAFYHAFGTSDLLLFGKELYLVAFYDAFGAIAFPIFGEKQYLVGFTMILAHLLVLFSIKFRRWPKAVQGEPTGAPGRPKRSQRRANRSLRFDQIVASGWR